jgi:hypothetical protein
MRFEEARGFPTVGTLLFLVESYEPHWYYFEVLECVRRLLLASIVGLVSENSPANALVGILICAFFIWVFTEAKPFKDANNDTLSVVLAYSLFFFFLSALLIFVSVASQQPSDQRVYGACLIAILAFGPSTIITQIFGAVVIRIQQMFQRSNANATLRRVRAHSDRLFAPSDAPTLRDRREHSDRLLNSKPEESGFQIGAESSCDDDESLSVSEISYVYPEPSNSMTPRTKRPIKAPVESVGSRNAPPFNLSANLNSTYVLNDVITERKKHFSRSNMGRFDTGEDSVL